MSLYWCRLYFCPFILYRFNIHVFNSILIVFYTFYFIHLCMYNYGVRLNLSITLKSNLKLSQCFIHLTYLSVSLCNPHGNNRQSSLKCVVNAPPWTCEVIWISDHWSALQLVWRTNNLNLQTIISPFKYSTIHAFPHSHQQGKSLLHPSVTLATLLHMGAYCCFTIPNVSQQLLNKRFTHTHTHKSEKGPRQTI